MLLWDPLRNGSNYKQLVSVIVRDDYNYINIGYYCLQMLVLCLVLMITMFITKKSYYNWDYIACEWLKYNNLSITVM